MSAKFHSSCRKFPSFRAFFHRTPAKVEIKSKTAKNKIHRSLRAAPTGLTSVNKLKGQIEKVFFFRYLAERRCDVGGDVSRVSEHATRFAAATIQDALFGVSDVEFGGGGKMTPVPRTATRKTAHIDLRKRYTFSSSVLPIDTS